jgi:hypothetical protein
MSKSLLSSVIFCFIRYQETCVNLGATLWFLQACSLPRNVCQSHGNALIYTSVFVATKCTFSEPLPSNEPFRHNIIHHWAEWRNGNSLDSYSESVWFESESRYRLFLLRKPAITCLTYDTARSPLTQTEETSGRTSMLRMGFDALIPTVFNK